MVNRAIYDLFQSNAAFHDRFSLFVYLVWATISVCDVYTLCRPAVFQELIPLLLSAIQLHPDVRQRDVLLNLLFNLIKRPDAQQRAVILAGTARPAPLTGRTRGTQAYQAGLFSRDSGAMQ